MVRKKAIKSLRYAFDKKLHISSDFDLIYRLSDFCNFDYLNKYLASYRVHEKNESNKNSSIELNELNYIFKKIKKDKLLKNDFINDNMNYAEVQEVNDPKNKIILIYNHGQDDHDEPSKNCFGKMV